MYKVEKTELEGSYNDDVPEAVVQMDDNFESLNVF